MTKKQKKKEKEKKEKEKAQKEKEKEIVQGKDMPVIIWKTSKLLTVLEIFTLYVMSCIRYR